MFLDGYDAIMAEQLATNVTWHNHKVTREEREKLNGHKGAVLWFTGLSGCGKSSVANTVDHLLHSLGKHSYVLDGDNIRLGLNKNLTFSAEDRVENIRRIGEVTKLFAHAGNFTLAAFISPYKADRDMIRELLQPGEFIEVYVKASLETCEKRDPKGLYKKARAGEIKGFTGIDAPYEPPEDPEIILDSNTRTIDELAKEVVEYLEKTGYFSVDGKLALRTKTQQKDLAVKNVVSESIESKTAGDQCAACGKRVSAQSMSMNNLTLDSLFGGGLSAAQLAGRSMKCDSCSATLCAECCVRAGMKKFVTRHLCPKCGGNVSPSGTIRL